MAVILERFVPTNFIARVKAMLDDFATNDMRIHRGGPFTCSTKIEFAEQEVGESPEEFGERFILEFMLSALSNTAKAKKKREELEAMSAIVIEEDAVNRDDLDEI